MTGDLVEVDVIIEFELQNLKTVEVFDDNWILDPAVLRHDIEFSNLVKITSSICAQTREETNKFIRLQPASMASTGSSASCGLGMAEILAQAPSEAPSAPLVRRLQVQQRITSADFIDENG
ncbi:uncharacterized protein A4U43_C07F33330 [Asparagus officinalis]|uniref:Uncharacterized protein n=1 Tax=Asparagus officinalis TaxID=4686 RepID=A0A5P1EGV8_ASPOF|nr:uncharacterized protein A4U43_C07F33330 [Asparagus officinalis]